MTTKPEIPAGAYRCRLCWSRCRCHNLPHVECPAAELQHCWGGCGRRTTKTESCNPGFCRACAHAPQRMNAWRVSSLVETIHDKWEEQLSEPMSYTDALDLGWKL